MVTQVNTSYKAHSSGSQRLLAAATKIESSASAQEQGLKQLMAAIERLKRATA